MNLVYKSIPQPIHQTSVPIPISPPKITSFCLFQDVPRTWLKLPSLLDGQLQLQPVASAVPTLLSSAFHLLLATDAAQRGESDRARAHEVLAELETSAVTAPQLWLGALGMALVVRRMWNTMFLYVETRNS